MSHKNYMGKIDEDFSGTTIPNYDSPKAKNMTRELITKIIENLEGYDEMIHDEAEANDHASDTAEIHEIIEKLKTELLKA